MKMLRLILIVFLITSCVQEPSEPPIKIGIDSWFGFVHAFIAQEQKLFAKYGVEVDLVLKPSLNEVDQIYRKRQLDGLFSVLPNILILNTEGLPTQIVYIADYSNTGDVIFGQPELTSLQDLKGKTIAFEGINTFSHLFVVKLLEHADIKEGEFKGVNLSIPEILTALESGEVDAGHIFGPTQIQATKKGYKILAKAGDMPGVITDVLAFKTTVIKKRPQDIQGVVNAMSEARDFLYNQPDKALAIMAQASNISKSEMEIGIKGIYHPDLSEQISALKFDGTLFDVGQQVTNFYFEKGQLPRLPNLKNIINGKFVQAVQ